MTNFEKSWRFYGKTKVIDLKPFLGSHLSFVFLIKITFTKTFQQAFLKLYKILLHILSQFNVVKNKMTLWLSKFRQKQFKMLPNILNSAAVLILKKQFQHSKVLLFYNVWFKELCLIQGCPNFSVWRAKIQILRAVGWK